MLTERAKRRIDAQQLCNFTALDKQTKQELMMSGRRRMYTSRHMAHGGRGGGGVPGSGVLARHACHNLMWGGRTWRRAALRTLGALCTLTLCPHQAATHTRRCVRGPQRGGHGRRRVQIARATGPPTAARADVGPRAEVMRYSAQRAYRFTWVLDS